MSRCPTDTGLLAPDNQHARFCARCRTRLALAPGTVPTVDDPPDALPSHGVGRQLIDALNEVAGDGPHRGQIWRLEFDGTAVPVAILEIGDDGGQLTVAPLGEDPEYADLATIRVTEEDSPLGFEFGIWTAVEHRVPVFTADRVIGQLPSEAWAKVKSCRRGLREGTELSGAGAPLASEADPRLVYRAALERDLLELAHAAWAVVNQVPAEVSFRDVLDEHGVGRRELRELGFSNHELGALSEDRLILTEMELSRIARQAEVDVQELQQAAPHAPRPLVIELHTPERRRQLLQAGLKHDHGPAQERREAIRGVVMAGKRSREAGAEPDWSDALDKWFAQR